jgi:uncharacterized SAM-binding protein YcdF (DUF218 family)
MTDFIKFFLIPGSPWCLLIGLTVCLALAHAWRALGRTAIWGLTVLAGLYWICSLSPVSDRLATRFDPQAGRPRTAQELAGVSAIVLLGAGVHTYMANGLDITMLSDESALNALEGARVYRLLHPVAVVASGGIADLRVEGVPESEVLRDVLIRFGVPADRILLESTSRTTHEQALNVAPLLRARHWERFALVASPMHMPRAAAAFRAQGVDPVPSVARFRSDSLAQTPRWRPNDGSLGVSRRAFYDYMAWLYYWQKGWFRAAT